MTLKEFRTLMSARPKWYLGHAEHTYYPNTPHGSANEWRYVLAYRGENLAVHNFPTTQWELAVFPHDQLDEAVAYVEMCVRME